MKKVAIITYHYYYNYGTMLQAYALQEAVDRNGCDAVLLNYRKPSVPTSLAASLKRIPFYISHIDKVVKIAQFRDVVLKKIARFKSLSLIILRNQKKSFIY